MGRWNIGILGGWDSLDARPQPSCVVISMYMSTLVRDVMSSTR